MTASNLTELTIRESVAAMDRGDVRSRDLVDAYIDRIHDLDGAVRSFIAVTADIARAQADEADSRRGAGERGRLLGVPYGLKDIFTTKGITTTAGSAMLADYVPPDSSAAYRTLRSEGAVLLGKLNLDEFAMGSSTENSAFFTTRNPWDLDRVPGGSSGGSAAAVAAELCSFALGTDTGGSIRQPAALCGVVGMKPTYGRVSRYGMIAFASSLDQAGPLARSVADVATVLEVLCGHDPSDATSLSDPVPALDDAVGAGVAGLRVGVPAEYFSEGLNPEVRSAVEEAIGTLRELGAETVPIRLPHTPSTPSRRTTWWLPPRRRRIWHGTTDSGTASLPTRLTSGSGSRRPGAKVSAPR